jgi:rod shape-determining protein MreC
VERRADSGFARITCSPQALVDGARHVMVLKASAATLPPRPAPEDANAPAKKGKKASPTP